MTFGVVIPWRDSGCSDRQKALDYLVSHYGRHWQVQVYEGDGNLNRARLRNEAVASSSWDVEAVIDADVFIPPAQVAYAFKWAEQERRLVKPYFVVGYTSRSASAEWISTTRDDLITANEFARLSVPWEGIHGGAFVMQRDAWLEVGGMDEGFEGWGGEDNAFNETCAKELGPIGLVDGYAFHLYHPRTEKMSQASIDRLLTYTQEDLLLPPYTVRAVDGSPVEGK